MRKSKASYNEERVTTRTDPTLRSFRIKPQQNVSA